MKHLVLGAGNLGLDLMSVLSNDNQNVTMLTRSGGFNYPEQRLPDLERYDVIWHAVGAGSVAQAKQDYQPFHDLHVELPRVISKWKYAKTKFIWFSTDYLCNEDSPSLNHLAISKPQSKYAESKYEAERELIEAEYPNTWAIRVGSLYGQHKEGFPERLRKNAETKNSVTLPSNRISPTPTHWIAEMVWKNFEKLTQSIYPIQHCGPVGTMTVAEWGRMILNDNIEVVEGGLDKERPAVCYLNCSFTENTVDAFQLWERYGR